MRFLITGVKGQLGYDLDRELRKRGHEVTGVDLQEMDITDPEACERVITEAHVDGVFHCAAYTAVDASENDEALCMRINVEGTVNVARVCEHLDIKMMYISTDYVFNGQGERPWEPDDLREPVNVYGKSKYLGEIAVTDHVEKFFIVRTSWVFGANGRNFVKTMLRLGRERDTITVVNDQIGSPTYTCDLSVLLADIMETDRYGFYHVTNEGLCSWYEFTEEIFRQAGMRVQLIPVTSKEYHANARRPLNSRMSKEKLTQNGFRRLPDWKDALGRYLAQLRREEQ